MDFGTALSLLKSGASVARAGWNGSGMFLFLFSQSLFCTGIGSGALDFPIDDESDRPLQGMGFMMDGMIIVPMADYIVMKTAQNTCVPWLAPQADVLAEDWIVVKACQN